MVGDAHPDPNDRRAVRVLPILSLLDLEVCDLALFVNDLPCRITAVRMSRAERSS